VENANLEEKFRSGIRVEVESRRLILAAKMENGDNTRNDSDPIHPHGLPAISNLLSDRTLPIHSIVSIHWVDINHR
jgi:hypothetical protein